MKSLSRVVGLLLALLLPVLAGAQVSPPVPKKRTDHSKQIIGYITQWGPWKSIPGLIPKGSLNHLNIDYSQYTILNFSFFGVAVDGSIHSGDYRNPNINQPGAEQQPAALVNTDTYSSWDLYLLKGELELVQYISDGSYPYSLGYRNAATGWSNVNTGETGAFPLAIHKQGGKLGIIDLAHQNGVKVMASLGGWSMSKHFGDMAATPAKRARFIADCKRLIALGFDGIDLDWEYPGQAGMNFTGQPQDYPNFAVLVEEIRAAIGPDKLITAAFSASPTKFSQFDWTRLSRSMNYFNFMTYDYNGGWSAKAGHNSPLYDYPNAEFSGFSLDATTKGIKAAGIPLNKVNLGVAFYGRGVVTNGPAALNAPTVKRQETVSPDGAVMTAADFANWPKDVWDGTPNYQAVLANTTSWTEQWDDNAKVPYKTNGTYFLSYDNERSVGLKAQYIKDQQLAGAIVWTASGDWTNLESGAVTLGGKLVYSPNTKAPLVNKMNEVFATGTTAANQAPAVSLTSPAANATAAAPALFTLNATAADADGTVSKVEFFQGTTKLGEDLSSPYTFSWTSVPAGTYSITAKATDNAGAVTTSAAVSVTVTGSTPNPSTSNRVIVGYFHNWNNASAPYIRLRDVNPKYNVVNISFAVPVAPGDMTMTFEPYNQPKTEFIADIKTLQAQGRRVQISIGGADAPVELNTTADKDKFVASMKAIVNEYGFDGFDIDLEGTSVILNSGDNNFKSSTTPKINNLVTASRELTSFYRGQGKDFWLTAAPEVQYVQGGYANYGTAFGGYLPVLYGLRDLLTFVHVQYYNTGSQNALDGKVYGQGNADFIVAMTDMLLRGFPVALNANNVFPALRQDQVAFGLPATGTGAAPAGGYVAPAEVTKALNYLVKGTSYGGQYALSATYPNLRGIMTWSINWDKTQGDPFVTNAYNFFNTTGPGNTSPTVSLTSPAANASFAAPASITINANAADADGTVAKVEFFQGTTKLGEDLSSPYTFSWANVAAGTYSLTAKATDNIGVVTTSAAVAVTVSSGPAVTNQPVPGKIEAESYVAMSGVDTEPTTDAGGGRNVDYFETNDWVEYAVNVALAGSYTVGFRVASANGGATLQLRNAAGTSLGSVQVGNTGGWQSWITQTATVTLPAGPQRLRVHALTSTGCNLNWLSFAAATAANQAPTVSLTAPTNNATFAAPASLTLTASAADADGTVAKVDFFSGSTLLGTDTSSPYTYAWTGVGAGSYSLTARATDNAGAVTTSAAVAVTVTGGTSGTCTVTAWQAATAYVNGNQVSRNGNLYTAKWWTQGEDPVTASCTDCPWRLNGPCGTGGGTNTAPAISFTSPASGASFAAPASVTVAATATDNVAVAKVEFFNGSTLLFSATVAPYSYTWPNVAAGTYTLTATATDNAGLTASTTRTITVNGTSPNPNPNPNPTAGLPARIMSGYWHTWNGGVPFIKLRDVHPDWDVINVSFAEPITPGSTDGRMKFEVTGLSASYTKADFKADISTLKSRGKKVVLSIGGYEGYFSLGSAAAVTQFANDIKSIVNEYGFDGIDIDTEQSSVTFNGGADPDFRNPTSPKVVNMIAAIRQVVDAYPSTFILSWAPETFYFQMGRQYYGGSNGNVDARSGVYIPMIHALRDRTTYVQAQLYNSMQMQGNDGQMYSMGTVEGIAAMTEMVIQGFTVGSPTGTLFPGLRADQVVIAVPASQGAAGSGQISNAGLQEAFRRVSSKYPGLRGIMTWSINWDAFQNNNSFVTSNAAFLRGLTAVSSAASKSAGTSLVANSPAAAVSLYPNPALAGTRLTLDLGASYAAVQVTLTDLAGRRIATYAFRDVRNAQFSLPTRDKGVLMLRIVADGNTFTRRVVVD